MSLLKKVLLIIVPLFILCGCSDESSNNAQKDHVWKEQIEAIDKAEEVEGKLMESAAATRKVIDEASQ